MPLVRYNATRSLTTGVTVGQQIVQEIPARYAGQVRQRTVVSNTRVSMSGRRETYFERAEDAWSISTKPLTEAEQAELVMFLDSVEQGEEFEFDPVIGSLGVSVLSNPGYEAGVIAPWVQGSGGSGFTVDSSAGAPLSGSYAGRITLAPNALDPVVQSPILSPAAEGQTWFVEGFAKRDEANLPNRNTELRVRWGTSGDVSITQPLVGTASTSIVGYQRLQGLVTAPATTAQFRYRWHKVAPHNTDETGRWFYDDATMSLLSAAPSWRTCELSQFGYSEPRQPELDSMIAYQLSIVEVP